MSHTTNAENHCPACNALLDKATAVSSDDGPEPGDLSVCARCGEFLKFTAGLLIVTLAEDELAKLDQSTRNQLSLARFYIRAYRRTLGIN